MEASSITLDNESGEVVSLEVELQTQCLTDQAFSDEEGVRKTVNSVLEFVNSYVQNKHSMPLEGWLDAEFAKHPTIWLSEDERRKTAQEIINSVEQANNAKVDLYAQLDSGKSRESWLARKLEQGAAISGTANVGEYAEQIDSILETATNDMANMVYRKGDLGVSQNPSLDGFIAEQHHVDTFNNDAVVQGSAMRARVLKPEAGAPFQENSMDIGIYDGNDRLIKRYQVKYCQDAKATEKAFQNGNYRGQRRLAPAEQAKDIEGATDVIEAEGIKSKPLTKAEAKEMQAKAQIKSEVKKYDWNDINRIKVAKEIGNKAMMAAVATVGLQGARILARRVWNFLQGEENQPINEDLKEFFVSSVKSGAHVGLQVALVGGVVVAARNGWIKILRKTPAGQIANIVYVGLENAKVIYKFLQGELSGAEAVDAMGNVTCSAVGGIMGALKGAVAGAAIGALLGPVGASVGGFIGGVAGCIAGSTVGQLVYGSAKKLASLAHGGLRSLRNFASSGANKLLDLFA